MEARSPELQTSLTLEEELELAFAAQLGASSDVAANQALSQQERLALDAQIFTDLKQTLYSAASLETMTLYNSMVDAIMAHEANCQDDHFAQNLATHNVFNDQHDHHDHDAAQDDKKADKDKKKKKKLRRGWLSWFAND